eukprot:14424112-Heterocapsa_arctica.AAC.1
MHMDTSNIAIPEVMGKWKRKEEESMVEHKKHKTEKGSEEMDLAIIEASIARADPVGKKGEKKTDFTCDDYETEETKHWWDEEFDEDEDE